MQEFNGILPETSVENLIKFLVAKDENLKTMCSEIKIYVKHFS